MKVPFMDLNNEHRVLRPDLLKNAELDDEAKEILRKIENETG